MSVLQELDDICRKQSVVINILLNKYISETNLLLDEVIYSAEKWDDFMAWIDKECVVEKKNFQYFKDFAGLLLNDDVYYLKYKSKSLMDLNIEKIGFDRLAMSHYFEHNGDLLADPDVEFIIDSEHELLIPMTFQNDTMNYFVDASLDFSEQKEIGQFLLKWFEGAIAQGQKLCVIHTENKSYSVFEDPQAFESYCKDNNQNLDYVYPSSSVKVKQKDDDLKYRIDYNKFDEEQLSQIKRGFEEGFDAYVYAKPEFNASQMNRILQGMEDDLDVSIYAKPEFNENQMVMIYLGLYNEIDVSIYAKPEFNEEQMEQIFEGLNFGLDVSEYADPNISEEEMKEIRLELLQQQEEMSM